MSFPQIHLESPRCSAAFNRAALSSSLASSTSGACVAAALAKKDALAVTIAALSALARAPTAAAEAAGVLGRGRALLLGTSSRASSTVQGSSSSRWRSASSTCSSDSSSSSDNRRAMRRAVACDTPRDAPHDAPRDAPCCSLLCIAMQRTSGSVSSFRLAAPPTRIACRTRMLGSMRRSAWTTAPPRAASHNKRTCEQPHTWSGPGARLGR